LGRHENVSNSMFKNNIDRISKIVHIVIVTIIKNAHLCTFANKYTKFIHAQNVYISEYITNTGIEKTNGESNLTGYFLLLSQFARKSINSY
jgi:hypothetical protein